MNMFGYISDFFKMCLLLGQFVERYQGKNRTLHCNTFMKLRHGSSDDKTLFV